MTQATTKLEYLQSPPLSKNYIQKWRNRLRDIFISPETMKDIQGWPMTNNSTFSLVSIDTNRWQTSEHIQHRLAEWHKRFHSPSGGVLLLSTNEWLQLFQENQVQFKTPEALQEIERYGATEMSDEIQATEVSTEPEDSGAPLNVVHRACLGCVFAQWQNTCQTGCSTGRLDKFQALNQVVDGYNEEANFKIINRTCNMFREHAWAAKKEFKNLEEAAREEIRTQVDVLLYLGEDYSEIKLRASLASLKTQTLKPNKVIVISNQSVAKAQDIISLLRVYADGLNWFLHRTIERAADGSFVRTERAIDIIFNQIEGQFYAYLPIGSTLSAHFIENIDRRLNDDLEQFVLLLDKVGELSTYVVSTKVHKILNGNNPETIYPDQIENDGTKVEQFLNSPVRTDTLIQKIIFTSQQSKSEHMVRDIKCVGGV